MPSITRLHAIIKYFLRRSTTSRSHRRGRSGPTTHRRTPTQKQTGRNRPRRRLRRHARSFVPRPSSPVLRPPSFVLRPSSFVLGGPRAAEGAGTKTTAPRATQARTAPTAPPNGHPRPPQGERTSGPGAPPTMYAGGGEGRPEKLPHCERGRRRGRPADAAQTHGGRTKARPAEDRGPPPSTTRGRNRATSYRTHPRQKEHQTRRGPRDDPQRLDAGADNGRPNDAPGTSTSDIDGRATRNEECTVTGPTTSAVTSLQRPTAPRRTRRRAGRDQTTKGLTHERRLHAERGARRAAKKRERPPTKTAEAAGPKRARPGSVKDYRQCKHFRGPDAPLLDIWTVLRHLQV
jgi:hypothetical protein